MTCGKESTVNPTLSIRVCQHVSTPGTSSSTSSLLIEQLPSERDRESRYYQAQYWSDAAGYFLDLAVNNPRQTTLDNARKQILAFKELFPSQKKFNIAMHFEQVKNVQLTFEEPSL